MPSPQTILGYTLKREIGITITAITGRGCEVIFQGDGAYTNGHTISLPATDDASLYEIAAANVVRGYGQHEGAHHLYTPFDEVYRLRNETAGCDLTDENVVKGLKSKPRSREWHALVLETFNFWNASEDWRIEHHQMRDWPGTRINIDATRSKVNRDDIKRNLERPECLLSPFETASALLTWMNAVENGYSCADLARQSIEIARQVNPTLVEIVEPYWPAMIATADLSDLDATRVIWRNAQSLCETLIQVYLKDQPPPPKKPPSPPPPDAKGQGSRGPTPEDEGASGPSTKKTSDNAESESKGADSPSENVASQKDHDAGEDQQAGTPDTNVGNPNASDHRKPGDSKADVSKDEPPKDASPGVGDGDDTDQSADDAHRADALRKSRDAAKKATIQVRNQLDVTETLKEFAAIAKDVEGQGQRVSKTSIAESIFVQPRPEGSGSAAEYRATQMAIATVTSALSGAMRTLVIARDRRRTRYNREDGDLDMTNILGMAMREVDIYQHTKVYPGNNTAISFLLDISASMQEATGYSAKTRITIAIESLVALLEALGPARRVSTRFEAYTTHTPQKNKGHKPVCRVLKNFNDSPTMAKLEISRLQRDLKDRSLRMGGTPTGELMLEGWQALRQRPEDKRVMFLITDGEPDDKGLANRAAQAIKAQGGIVIGIGVGGTPLFTLDTWILVPRIEELPVKMLGAIRTIVT